MTVMKTNIFPEKVVHLSVSFCNECCPSQLLELLIHYNRAELSFYKAFSDTWEYVILTFFNFNLYG